MRGNRSLWDYSWLVGAQWFEDLLHGQKDIQMSRDRWRLLSDCREPKIFRVEGVSGGLSCGDVPDTECVRSSLQAKSFPESLE